MCLCLKAWLSLALLSLLALLLDARQPLEDLQRPKRLCTLQGADLGAATSATGLANHQST